MANIANTIAQMPEDQNPGPKLHEEFLNLKKMLSAVPAIRDKLPMLAKNFASRDC